MSALHVVVRPRPIGNSSPALAALTGLIDVVVDGVNLTARVGEGPLLDFLVDSSLGLVSVVQGARGRAIISLHTDDDVWELGFEGAGPHVLLSVFRQSPTVAVAAFERSLSIVQLRDALSHAMRSTLEDKPAVGSGIALGLKAALRALEELGDAPISKQRERVTVQLSAARRGFHADASLAVRRAEPSAKPSVERSDLHGILGLGSFELHYGPNRATLERAHVALDVERLLVLAEEALDSHRTGRPTFRRALLSSGRASMRRGPGDDGVEFKVEPVKGRPFFAVIPTLAFVSVLAKLARDLTGALCKHDPQQEMNLRVSRLRQAATELLGRVQPIATDETVTNSQPDSYRRFVRRVKRTSGMWDHGAKMRFAPRWVATVPRINLKATFLCGDRLIVGGAHETACLERRTGEILWRKQLNPAASVVTPSGLVRIEADGALRCHQLENGEVRFGLRLKPRIHGGATGSVLYGPGLPKLLATTEGDRQITGIDLVTGEVRWRYTAKRPAPYRVRRAGRLLVVGGGDPLLFALDGVSGEVVWSLRSRLPFSGDIALDHETACTLSGAPGGSHQLHQIHPWTGEERWAVELDDRPLGRAPLLTPSTIVVPTTDEEGAGAVGYDRLTGKKMWEHAPGLVQGMSAWLAVDDCILVNCARGILLALDARDGSVRFNHVFSTTCEADQPRRLEPVLRSGALFVPQERVHVVRPLNGEVLGGLPSDLVPDLIRVDERCDVYVAEESGHLAAFGVAPRLSLVK